MSGGLSNIASAIVGSQQKWERKPADFYPTPADVTFSLLPHLNLPVGANVLEPACGDGAMAKVLTAAGLRVTATDLRDDSGYGCGGIDFAAYDEGHLRQFDAVITNPPFNVAQMFIEKSVPQVPVVAMLLKSQYWHAARRRAFFEKHPPAQILALTWRPSFLEKERGRSPLMDVIWTVWDSRSTGPTRFLPIKRLVPPTPSIDIDDLLGDVSEMDDIAALLG